MRRHRHWSCIILLFLIGCFCFSCAPKQVETKPSFYYVTPVITYLKECPEIDCKPAGEVHRADRLEKLEAKDGWWRMQVVGGTLKGWLQKELVSPQPVAAVYFYVAVDSLELKECPRPDCPFQKILLKGDRVQKIDDNGQGWLRVLVEKDASIGWVIQEQVSEKVQKAEVKPAPEKVFYYAAAASVNLHSLPLFSSVVVKSLTLNAKLEKVAQHGKDWFKVRHRDSGAEGWVAAKYLTTSPVPPKKPKLKKKPRRKTRPKPPAAPLKPEAM